MVMWMTTKIMYVPFEIKLNLIGFQETCQKLEDQCQI